MVVSGDLHPPAALPLHEPQSQFCLLTHEKANTVLCDLSTEAKERVLLIEKQYVHCKVRVYVTGSVENREYNVISIVQTILVL
jgi:hypothetical protein